MENGNGTLGGFRNGDVGTRSAKETLARHKTRDPDKGNERAGKMVPKKKRRRNAAK